MPLFLVCLMLVGSFAYLTTKETATKVNKLHAGTLNVVFDNEETEINITQGIPMTQEYAIENIEPYTFTVANDGDVKASYDIYISEEDYINEIEDSDGYVYSILAELKNDNIDIKQAITDSDDKREVCSNCYVSWDTFYLNPGESKKFAFISYIPSDNYFDDENIDDFNNKVVSYKLKLDAEAISDPTYVLKTTSYKDTLSNRDSRIKEASSIIFTDNEIDMSIVDYEDLSEAYDESVLGYLDGTTYYITSNKPGQKIYTSSSASYLLQDCINLTSISFNNLDMTYLKNVSFMFFNCKALTTLDLSSWNNLKLTSFTGLFSNCTNLTTIIGLENIDTSNVTSMQNMFSGCSSLTSLDLSNFDTSKVTYMDSMFSGCSSLTSLDVSNFDTSKVTSMSSMFSGCKNLITLDISSFNTSNVVFMYRMFAFSSSLTNIYIGEGWTTSNLTAYNATCELFYNDTLLPNYNPALIYDASKAYAGDGGYLTLK